MKQKVFPRNKLKKPDTRSKEIDETWLIVIDLKLKDNHTRLLNKYG